jgi:hypothetical protein
MKIREKERNGQEMAQPPCSRARYREERFALLQKENSRVGA